MTHQRKTAADYGQLSLFAETVPEWLQSVETAPEPVNNLTTAPVPDLDDDDDDLGQFTAWLQQGKQTNPP